jgi:hypothetical protein
MQCPHGGVVQVVTTNTKVKAAGAPILQSTDTFIVAGCAFTLPGGKPSPCLTVRWMKTDMNTKIDRAKATLSLSSSGMCYSPEQAPQGPVVIVSTQSSVSTK